MVSKEQLLSDQDELLSSVEDAIDSLQSGDSDEALEILESAVADYEFDED